MRVSGTFDNESDQVREAVVKLALKYYFALDMEEV